MKRTLLTAWLIAAALILSFSSSYAFSEQDERKLGEQTAAKLEAQYGTIPEHPALKKIRAIGYSLAAVSDRPHLHYEFYVLNTDTVNAVSCPGGIIYVTKGIIPLLTDEELAFVLAHEIAHAARGHGVKQSRKNTITKLGISGLILALGKGKTSRASQTAASAMSTIASKSYSRKDEDEADRTACHYMFNGPHMNPRAGISFMIKLKSLQKTNSATDFLNGIIGDHPLTDDRIKSIDQECSQMGF